MSEPRQEYLYYLDHKAELLDKYRGRFIVIKGREVIGVFDDRLQALVETSKTHPVGTFIVQEVSELDEEVRFYSRYAIAQ